MFYLLLFCIFDNEKLSQRTLEDTFNSSGFKALFGLGEEEKVRRSSISERLSKIDSNYFNPNSAIEKKEYFSILISNCVAVEKNKR
jgi:hypothetical protein